MIRVLNIISGLNNAGTEAVVMNYYRYIDRTKIQFDFLVLDDNDNLYYEDEIKRLGGRIFKIVNFKKNPISNIIKRKHFFKKYAKDYVVAEIHSPTAYRYTYCKLAKKAGIKKVIFHIHSTSYEKGWLINHARRMIEKYCDKTVTCSQYAARSVLGKNADEVVCNAIDYDKYRFNAQLRSKIRSFYGIKDEEKVIGHIGRFSEPKNHEFLLGIFSKIVAADNTYKLILKGFGELKNRIVEQINQLGLENYVIIDYKFDSFELYNCFDLFVLPSLYEGLGVVLIEAQANRLKCIISEKVPKEVDLTGENQFLELDADKWIKSITEANMQRLTADWDFSSTGYDINIAAKNLEEYYLKCNEQR